MAQIEQAGLPGLDELQATVDMDALVKFQRANGSERDAMLERLTDDEMKHLYCCFLQHLTARRATGGNGLKTKEAPARMAIYGRQAQTRRNR